MSRVTDGPGSDVNRSVESSGRAGARGGQEPLVGKVVCPFCGQHKSNSAEPCPRCTMEDTPATRQATKARIGPWYVLQNRSPSAPGMKYATLLWLVNKGHVTPRSIVRGPTTYQLWRYAAHVRGLSREFGLCYSCGGAIEKSSSICAHCERPQDPPADADALLDIRDPAGASSLRSPVMREIDPSQGRAAAEAQRTPPMPGASAKSKRAKARHADEGRFDPAVAAAMTDHDDAEASHLERLRTRNEMTARQRAEMARRGGGSTISATNLAVALQDPDDAPARARRISVLSVMLFVLLLASGAAAAVLYIKPEYREPTAQWVNDTWTTVRDKLAAMQWNSLPGDPPAGRTVQSPPLRDSSPAPTQPPAPLAAPPPLAAVDQAQQPQSQPQTTQPPLADPGPQLARSADIPRVDHVDTAPQRPAPEPHISVRVKEPDPPKTEPRAQRSAERTRTTQPPQQSPAPAVSEPRTVEQAMDESRRLYRQAIDAEAQGDYEAALRNYEQIQKLPRETWQGDLQIRIGLTRDRLKRSAQSE